MKDIHHSASPRRLVHAGELHGTGARHDPPPPAPREDTHREHGSEDTHPSTEDTHPSTRSEDTHPREHRSEDTHPGWPSEDTHPTNRSEDTHPSRWRALADGVKLGSMTRALMMMAGVHGFLAVALGAFGAHGLRAAMAELSDGAKRLEWWGTAAQYHLIHALAIGLAATLLARAPGPATVAGVAFSVGCLLFSGSLYTMTLTGVRALGAVTPLGGVAFLVGWGALTVAGWQLR